MNKLFFISFVCLFLSVGLFAQNTDDWELITDKENIQIYTRLTDVSPIKQLKVKAVFDTDVQTLLSVLNNVENYPKWVYKCMKAERLQSVSSGKFYYRTVSDLPWPVSDRDVVLLTKQWKVKETGVYKTKSSAKPDFMSTVENIVRIPLYESAWTITPTEQNTVEIEYTALTEVGGQIPDWMVNLGLSAGPYETMRGLKNYLEQTEVRAVVVK